MELLKELVSLIKDLPDLAIWIIGIFFIYKIFIVGSIYGVLRLAIIKAHDAYSKERVITSTYKFRGLLMDKHAEEEMYRLMLKIKQDHLMYVHDSDIKKVISALDRAND